MKKQFVKKPIGFDSGKNLMYIGDIYPIYTKCLFPILTNFGI